MKAFPVTKFNSHRVGHDGMDLRDYFAATVIGTAIESIKQSGYEGSNLYHRASDLAYKIADAMLEARNK